MSQPVRAHSRAIWAVPDHRARRRVVILARDGSEFFADDACLLGWWTSERGSRGGDPPPRRSRWVKAWLWQLRAGHAAAVAKVVRDPHSTYELDSPSWRVTRLSHARFATGPAAMEWLLAHKWVPEYLGGELRADMRSGPPDLADDDGFLDGESDTLEALLTAESARRGLSSVITP